MAVIVYSSDPPALLRAVGSATKDGKIETWSTDSDGDFTHSPEQWRKKAWFRPKLSDGRIIFNIFPPQKTVMSSVTYAVYHGRFVEMLLAHFDTQFDRAVATALPSEGDRVKT
jgi:hypothetical protein